MSRIPFFIRQPLAALIFSFMLVIYCFMFVLTAFADGLTEAQLLFTLQMDELKDAFTRMWEGRT